MLPALQEQRKNENILKIHLWLYSENPANSENDHPADVRQQESSVWASGSDKRNAVVYAVAWRVCLRKWFSISAKV